MPLYPIFNRGLKSIYPQHPLPAPRSCFCCWQAPVHIVIKYSNGVNNDTTVLLMSSTVRLSTWGNSLEGLGLGLHTKPLQHPHSLHNDLELSSSSLTRADKCHSNKPCCQQVVRTWWFQLSFICFMFDGYLLMHLPMTYWNYVITLKEWAANNSRCKRGISLDS